MDSRELIKKSFRCEETERIPWVPFVGVHGAFLIEKDAEEYLKSSELIVKGVTRAAELYKADGIPVLFDLQVEAEALGCELIWKKDNPPAVVSHPLSDGSTVDTLPEYSKDSGRLPLIAKATRELREKLPDKALYGLVTGPFTLALHLLGTDIFLKMMMETDMVLSLMDYTSEIVRKTASVYIENGCDVIALVDPMTSQIDPSSFETFVSPAARNIFQFVKSRDALTSFFVCGQAQQNIEVMCNTEPDNISIDENISLDFVRDIALPKKVSFGGNLQLTANLLLGDENDCRIDALDCMEKGGKKGFILAPGCDLPMETPTANLKAVTELVHDPYQQEVTKALTKKTGRFENPNLDDHWKKDKVVVDVITLDSSSCAPCQYMVEAMINAAGDFTNIEVAEYRIKTIEGLQLMKSFGVSSIPTTCIEGKPVFESQIPSVELIKEKYAESLKEKGLD